MTGMMNPERSLWNPSPASGPGGRQPFPLSRLLAFSMILVLLTARLGSYSEEVLVTPVEDAIFDIAFMVDGGKSPQTKYQVIKTKALLDGELVQYQVPVRIAVPMSEAVPDCVPAFSPADWVGEIFIPPEQPS